MYIYIYISGWWLNFNPSEKYEDPSIGMMKFPTEWKNTSHVPKHQPDGISEWDEQN